MLVCCHFGWKLLDKTNPPFLWLLIKIKIEKQDLVPSVEREKWLNQLQRRMRVWRWRWRWRRDWDGWSGCEAGSTCSTRCSFRELWPAIYPIPCLSLPLMISPVSLPDPLAVLVAKLPGFVFLLFLFFFAIPNPSILVVNDVWDIICKYHSTSTSYANSHLLLFVVC